MNEGRDKPPEIVALRLNETNYFKDSHGNLPEDLNGKISAIYSVYLYDDTVRTFCCEITPSFFLRWVDVVLDFTDGIEESERDKIYDEMRDVYTRDNSDCYMHISTVEKFEHRKVFMKGNDFEPWWKEYDEEKIWDEVIEAYHQCPFF